MHCRGESGTASSKSEDMHRLIDLIYVLALGQHFDHLMMLAFLL